MAQRGDTYISKGSFLNEPESSRALEAERGKFLSLSERPKKENFYENHEYFKHLKEVSFSHQVKIMKGIAASWCLIESGQGRNMRWGIKTSNCVNRPTAQVLLAGSICYCLYSAHNPAKSQALFGTDKPLECSLCFTFLYGFKRDFFPFICLDKRSESNNVIKLKMTDAGEHHLFRSVTEMKQALYWLKAWCFCSFYDKSIASSHNFITTLAACGVCSSKNSTEVSENLSPGNRANSSPNLWGKPWKHSSGVKALKCK